MTKRRSTPVWLLGMGALLAASGAQSQIYTCRAADGTRIFSDERCGPDARLMPGVTSKKRPGTRADAAAKPVSAAPRSAVELDELLRKCDTGDIPSCNAWTRGGGPNRLRQKEQRARAACDAGSLSACEERYCSDGATKQCRSYVLRTAPLAGESWYLREAGKRQADGTTQYQVRCFREAAGDTGDLQVSCAAQPGPQRCSSAGSQRAFPQLEAAASGYCARR